MPQTKSKSAREYGARTLVGLYVGFAFLGLLAVGHALELYEHWYVSVVLFIIAGVAIIDLRLRRISREVDEIRSALPRSATLSLSEVEAAMATANQNLSEIRASIVSHKSNG